MKSYLELLHKVLNSGERRIGRNGLILSSFADHIAIDLQKGFPLLTTKKVHFKSVVVELLWFLKGDTNIKYLNDNGVTIWDEWADKDGNLGRVYGKQWRSWNDSIDQVHRLIEDLKADPYSRRHIISSWNVSDLDNMALPPCHCLIQFYVSDEGLSCQVYQRSCDIFLGLPFNIASYALLTMMVAQICNLTVNKLYFSFGDLHLYGNHIGQAKEQLYRSTYPLPDLKLNNKIRSIDNFKYEDIKLINYNSHSCIKAPISK